MTEQHDREPTLERLSDASEFHGVLDYRVPTAFPEVTVCGRRLCRASVAAMIIRVHMKPRVIQERRDMCISERVLAESMRDLDHSDGVPGREPPVVNDPQSIAGTDKRKIFSSHVPSLSTMGS